MKKFVNQEPLPQLRCISLLVGMIAVVAGILARGEVISVIAGISSMMFWWKMLRDIKSVYYSKRNEELDQRLNSMGLR